MGRRIRRVLACGGGTREMRCPYPGAARIRGWARLRPEA